MTLTERNQIQNWDTFTDSAGASYGFYLCSGNTYNTGNISDLNRAFSNTGFELQVADAGYAGDSTDASYSGYWSDSCSPQLEDQNREYVLGQDTLEGLEIDRKIYVPKDGNFVRYLDIFHNPTGSPIDVHIWLLSQYGDGITPVVSQTSSGDTTLQNTDHWMAMYRSGDTPPTYTYAPLAMVWDGRRNYDKADIASFGNDGTFWSLWEDVSIPAAKPTYS